MNEGTEIILSINLSVFTLCRDPKQEGLHNRSILWFTIQKYFDRVQAKVDFMSNVVSVAH